MLMPKRVKYRKLQSSPRIKGYAKGSTEINWGEYAIKALEPKWITARQIEASRITIVRYLKKKGKMWIRIFPDKSITKHPAETRMGKGKGDPEHWVAVVKPGRIMFEIEGIDDATAEEIHQRVSARLPIKTKLIKRQSF
ncbi:MAG: 50S ribosomal protein L16 [Elusimicrobiales bacterium]|jgi:large subunit ribosomal protein L16|nr:50S ribosomal protein L16 [Elusimicrobiales bacterium]NLH38812.1 50S ribosomal protein L16 [Elusimicrobiota bacterium]